MRYVALVVALTTSCSSRDATIEVESITDSAVAVEADTAPAQDSSANATTDVTIEASSEVAEPADAGCAPRPYVDVGIYAPAAYGCGAPRPSSDACICGDKGFLHVEGDGPRRTLGATCSQGFAIAFAVCSKPTTFTACDEKGCIVLATWFGSSIGGHYVDRTGTCFELSDVKVTYDSSSAGGGDYVNGTFTATGEACGKKLSLSGDFRGCIVSRDTKSCE